MINDDERNMSDRNLVNRSSLRLRRVQIEDIWFKEHICDDFKNSQQALPEDIKIGRNRALMLAVPEIICCFAAFSLYELRRSRIILALDIMNIIVTSIGINSKLKLSYWGLLLHGVYCCSVIGGFYIYILIDYFMTKDQKTATSNHRTETQKHEAISDTGVMMLASLPLLLLFAMGIYSICLLWRLDEEYE